MQENEFKIGPIEIRSIRDSIRFNAYPIVKLLGALYCIVIAMVLLNFIAGTLAISPSALLGSVGASFLFFFLLLFPRFKRRIQKCAHFWFRFGDKSLQVYRDATFSSLWLEVPYDRVVSFHHFTNYMWRDGLLPAKTYQEPVQAFLRYEDELFASYTVSLDLGPKNASDLRRLILQVQRHCPSAVIRDSHKGPTVPWISK